MLVSVTSAAIQSRFLWIVTRFALAMTALSLILGYHCFLGAKLLFNKNRFIGLI
jgi:hypothetical protein